jgi:hypothetical protein
MKQITIDAFKTAGELFGRIQNQLGFGVLSMSFESHYILFNWSFTARRQVYQSQWRSDLLELHFDKGLDRLADRIVDRWKSDHRTVSQTQEGQT